MFKENVNMICRKVYFVYCVVEQGPYVGHVCECLSYTAMAFRKPDTSV